MLTRRTERSEATPNGRAHFSQKNGGRPAGALAFGQRTRVEFFQKS